MRCELRYLHSPDALDLESYRPTDSSSFSILIEAMIGPLGGRGEESFSFILCTPQYLAAELPDDRYRWAHGLLLVPYYNYRLLLDAVQRVCGRVEGQNWHDVGNQLSHYFNWEFADYRPDSSEA
jgi:immunity protein 8 of polymorphic toxin system